MGMTSGAPTPGQGYQQLDAADGQVYDESGAATTEPTPLSAALERPEPGIDIGRLTTQAAGTCATGARSDASSRMNPPPSHIRDCTGARELRAVLPELFWALVLLGNGPAHDALHGSRTVLYLCQILWVLAVPLNTTQLAHLFWKVSLGDPAIVDVARFPLYGPYWLDAVGFSLVAVVFCVQRHCIMHLSDGFLHCMAEDMSRFRAFWANSSRSGSATPLACDRFLLTLYSGRVGGHRLLVYFAISMGLLVMPTLIFLGFTSASSLEMLEGGPLLPNNTVAAIHIFADRPLAHARMVAGGVSLSLMTCEGFLLLAFVLHPVIREMSAVDGLRVKLSLIRDPAGCLKLQHNAVLRWCRLNQKLSCLATPWFCLLLGCPAAQFATFVHGWAVTHSYTSAGLGWAVAMAHVSPVRYLFMVWFVVLTGVQVWPLGAHSKQWASLHGTALQQMGAGLRDFSHGRVLVDSSSLCVLPRSVTYSPEWARLLALLHQLQGSTVFPAAGVVLHGVRIDTTFTLKWFIFYQALVKDSRAEKVSGQVGYKSPSLASRTSYA